jgi:hypothetical protein
MTENTEIRAFKNSFAPKNPDKSFIVLQMSHLRRIHRLGTNPDYTVMKWENVRKAEQRKERNDIMQSKSKACR